jgi:hypothetical protein
MRELKELQANIDIDLVSENIDWNQVSGQCSIRGIQQECFWKQGKRTWDWTGSLHGLRSINDEFGV